jgi:hypothetical protein
VDDLEQPYISNRERDQMAVVARRLPNHLPHNAIGFAQCADAAARLLSLVRKHLELKGAGIAVASEKSKGSTVALRFARDAAHDA